MLFLASAYDSTFQTTDHDPLVGGEINSVGHNQFKKNLNILENVFDILNIIENIPYNKDRYCFMKYVCGYMYSRL